VKARGLRSPLRYFGLARRVPSLGGHEECENSDCCVARCHAQGMDVNPSPDERDNAINKAAEKLSKKLTTEEVVREGLGKKICV